MHLDLPWTLRLTCWWQLLPHWVSGSLLTWSRSEWVGKSAAADLGVSETFVD